MPKLTSEQMTNRRERILRAALACAARKGFHQTSMRDVCREAKLSIGAVYNYFRSKEEILAAMTREGRQAKKLTLEELKNCRSARESFQELFRYLFLAYKNGAFRTYGAVDLETYCEAMRNKRIAQIMREEYASLTKPLADLVRHWQRKKEIRRDIDPDDLANWLVSLSVGIKIQLLVQPELTADGFEDVVRKAFLASLWSEVEPRQKK